MFVLGSCVRNWIKEVGAMDYTGMGKTDMVFLVIPQEMNYIVEPNPFVNYKLGYT